MVPSISHAVSPSFAPAKHMWENKGKCNMSLSLKLCPLFPLTSKGHVVLVEQSRGVIGPHQHLITIAQNVLLDGRRNVQNHVVGKAQRVQATLAIGRQARARASLSVELTSPLIDRDV